MARKMAPISKPLNTRAIGNGPTRNDSRTRTGATNRAIWAEGPMASVALRSILSGGEKETGAQYDADEERRQAEVLGGLGDGPDQDLRHHPAGHPGDGQHGHGPPDG